jgi:hypothetical protein
MTGYTRSLSVFFRPLLNITVFLCFAFILPLFFFVPFSASAFYALLTTQ